MLLVSCRSANVTLVTSCLLTVFATLLRCTPGALAVSPYGLPSRLPSENERAVEDFANVLRLWKLFTVLRSLEQEDTNPRCASNRESKLAKRAGSVYEQKHIPGSLASKLLALKTAPDWNSPGRKRSIDLSGDGKIYDFDY